MSKQTRPKLYVVKLKIIKFFILFQLEKINFIFFKSKKISITGKNQNLQINYSLLYHTTKKSSKSIKFQKYCN